MPLDHYLSLGRSGLRVSPLCLGAMTFGEEFGLGTDPATSMQLLDRYAGAGGNFVDTANIYNAGHSEQIIGQWLEGDPSRRERMVIATKFGGNLRPGNPNTGGASRLNILRSCDESLRRLRTDYIDLLWMHWWEPHTPIEETLQALDALVRAGKVRYLGFSDTPAWRVAQAQTLALLRGYAPLVALQIEYSLLERSVESELVPMALEFGLGITPWSPLRSGMLTGKYTREKVQADSPGRQSWIARAAHEEAFRVVDLLARIAQEAGSTPARCALAWLRGRAGVASTIIGARTLAQLDDNLASLALTLDAAQLAALDEISAVPANFPHRLLPMLHMVSYGGTTVNGITYAPPVRSTKAR